MPLQATSGAASYDGFGGGVPFVPTYIEEVFSTYLYTGNSSTQTITNGINLSTYGGLVWIKQRNAINENAIYTTNLGAGKRLITNRTDALDSSVPNDVTAFNANGFSLGLGGVPNPSGGTMASWTFRKQPKFFDVVTYTGNGTTQNIAHSLGSTPGCVIVKRTNLAANWFVWHRGLPAGYWLLLNDVQAQSNGSSANVFGNNTTYVDPTSTVFTVGNAAAVNASGSTYVAYIFAHNAGGFGLTGTDNVISCGSLTSASGGNATLTLNYEPQWILFKRTDAVGDWFMFDNMRGMLAPSSLGNSLYSNTSGAEVSAATRAPYVTSTSLTWDGVTNTLDSSGTYIYIAIRRGPMKTPTSGTSIYGTQLQVNTPTYSFPPDLIWATNRTGNATYSNWFVDRLRGSGRVIRSYSTGAETAELYSTFSPDGANNSWGPGWTGGADYEVSGFRRAPGFFDVVNVVTNGQTAPITSTHNLIVVPEMMIAKKRGPTGGTGDWCVYHKNLNGGVTPQNFRIRLNQNFAASAASGVWNNTAPTATQFTLGTDSDVNSGTAGDNTIVYLFASCPGVSKVGTYTGTGALQTINCGFTSGARFVLIKRTDSTGDWYVYDSARGITSGNDPYLFLNSTAAEVTGTNYVDTDTTGFKVTAAAPAGLNASGGTYIFLAIA